MIKRRTFLQQTAFASVPFLMHSTVTKPFAFSEEKPQRPNVVLIMTDDQGYGDLGVTSNPIIQTPNIDAMAKRSASMQYFYVCPVCAPTRACLMTGRYNYRTRCIDTYIGRAMMDPNEVTIAEILREAGYATGIFGKWHLGDNYPMRPIDQGFETALVHRGGGIGQPSDPPGGEGKYTDAILFENGHKVHTEGYCTDVYFDHACSWMEDCHENNRPFFAYIPTNAPHGPFHDVPEEEYEYYKDKDLSNDQFPQEEGHPLPDDTNEDRRARIFAMITNIDNNVGKLFKKLDNLGITENTLVIFLLDNGPNGRRYVAGMRGSKSSVYEGGIRSPIFLHWPSVLEAGRTSDQVSAHIDLLPTILDACQVEKPADLKLDGKSILPLLKEQPSEWKDRTIYIQSHRGDKPVMYHNFAARSQDWKLVHASGFGRESFEGDPQLELYDMKNDPLETQNVAEEHPDIVEKMKNEYEDWFHDVSSTRSDNYAPPRIYIGTPYENPVVLTRQDWRHIKGRPWGQNSNGYWKLYAPEAGQYNIHLRFPSNEEKLNIKLEVGDQTLTRSVSDNKTECVFQAIPLKKGNLRLKADLRSPDDTRGPWQVEVRRIDLL